MQENTGTDSTLAKCAIEFAMQWVARKGGKCSLDDVVQLLLKQSGADDVIDERPLTVIVTFNDGSGVGVTQDGLDLLQPTTDASKTAWKPEEWGGVSEEQAFDEDPMAVLEARGMKVASQTWSGGSWSSVYKYNGKYYAIDEVELCEYQNPKEAFERAGIGRDTYDNIFYMDVEPGYDHYIYKRANK